VSLWTAGETPIGADDTATQDPGERPADKRLSYLYEHFAELPIMDYDAGRAWIDSYRA